MSTIQKLPLEILHEIFSNIPHAQGLTEIRLVCKSWNNVAEKAMFKYPITVDSQRKFHGLVSHLEAAPENGKRIRYLNTHITSSPYRLPSDRVVLQLLDLAFTHNMVEFKGTFYPLMFKKIIEIKQKSNQEFKHLKVIPQPHHNDDFAKYYMAALLFKETLQELHINQISMNMIKTLKDFPCLTTLVVSGQALQLSQLRIIVAQCPRLVDLSWISAHPSPDPWPTNLHEMDAVSRGLYSDSNHTVKRLTIHCDCRYVELVLILLRRFSKLDKVTIVMEGASYLSLQLPLLPQIFLHKAMRQASEYDFTFFYPTPTSADTFFDEGAYDDHHTYRYENEGSGQASLRINKRKTINKNIDV